MTYVNSTLLKKQNFSNTILSTKGREGEKILLDII